MHVNAHESCTNTVRESALKVDFGGKIPCRTGQSNLPQRRAGPMLYQMSYIPTPVVVVVVVVVVVAVVVVAVCNNGYGPESRVSVCRL